MQVQGHLFEGVYNCLEQQRSVPPVVKHNTQVLDEVPNPAHRLSMAETNLGMLYREEIRN